jgi:hypothetical protein
MDPDTAGLGLRTIRGVKVMLSPDLAQLLGAPHQDLLRLVRREKDRYPPDFMFKLTPAEIRLFIPSRRGLRPPILAFTAEGLLMTSGLLQTPTAITFSVEVIRAFGCPPGTGIWE